MWEAVEGSHLPLSEWVGLMDVKLVSEMAGLFEGRLRHQAQYRREDIKA